MVTLQNFFQKVTNRSIIVKINEVINPRFVYENCSQIRSFFDGVEGEFKIDGLDLLILWILHESKNEYSEYSAYFDSLPTKFSVPYTNLTKVLVD